MIKIEKLIKNNNLGNEILSISKVTGGLSHKMYKVVTDEKIYAVKELNQGIMKNSDAYSNFVFSEQVADIVIKNKILAIGAIKLDNDIMKKIREKCKHEEDISNYKLFSMEMKKDLISYSLFHFH